MSNNFESAFPKEMKAPLDKAKIERYIAEVLPETEQRIAEPMDPRCEVAVVIPSCGERQYFFRPIESLLNQEGVTPDQFELIMVINNSEPKQKPEEDDETFAARLEQAQKGARENQENLKILQLIHGEDVDVELTEEEQALMKRIQESKLKVFGIDKATVGKTLPSERANVGGARNRGVAEAVARFYQMGKNGLIIQTDADTALDKHFIQNTLHIFKDQPELAGVSGYLEMDQTIEKGERIEKVYFFANLEKIYRTLVNYLLTHEQDLPKRKNFTGANMVSRAFETAIVGGVPEMGEKEDVDFGRRLDSINKTSRLNTLIARPVDRPSLRTAGTKKGHGHIRANQAKEIMRTGEMTVDSLEYFEMSEKLEEMAGQTTDLASLKALLTYNGTPLLDDAEMETLFAGLQEMLRTESHAQTPKVKALRYKAFSTLEALIPKESLSRAGQKVLEKLFENKRLHERYLEIVAESTPPPPFSSGIANKYQELDKKLRAMDKAQRTI